jgi:hypothetical protein
MPIALHNQCKKTIKSKLTNVLAKVKVHNNCFINRPSLFDVFEIEPSLPETGEKREQLERYISESPLFDFVYGSLSKHVNETNDYVSDSSDKLLTEFEGFSDSSKVAEDLVEKFDSLPWQYAFTFKLNSSIADYLPEDVIEISPDIRILKPHNELVDQFPLKSGIPGRDNYLHGFSLLSISTETTWNQGSLYVQVFKGTSINAVFYAELA